METKNNEVSDPHDSVEQINDSSLVSESDRDLHPIEQFQKKNDTSANPFLALLLAYFLAMPVFMLFTIGESHEPGAFHLGKFFWYLFSFSFWFFYFLTYFNKTKKIIPTLGKFLGVVLVSFLLIFSLPRLVGLFGFVGFLIVAYIVYLLCLGGYFLYKRFVIKK